MSGVRTAGVEDVALVGRIAAEAFRDDPVMSWALPDPVTRPAKLVAVFGGLARDVLPDRGRIDLADAASVAYWREPDFAHGEPAPEGTAGEAPSTPSPFTDDELVRFAEMDRVMHAAHPAERHWYLNVAGTLPSRQGQGLGAVVVSAVLERADASGLPCYLESTNPRNHTFYRRLGFEDRDELQLPDGPAMLAMWRPPRD